MRWGSSGGDGVEAYLVGEEEEENGENDDAIRVCGVQEGLLGWISS